MEKAEGEQSSGGRWVCYYDGDCRLCVRTARWLSRIDFFRRVSWTPYQSLAEPPDGLTWADLDSAAYLVPGGGRLHRGFYAFRMLTLKLLPLMPLAPVLWFPGVSLVGERAYRWIADNRYHLSGCRAPGVGANPSRVRQAPCSNRDTC